MNDLNQSKMRHCATWLLLLSLVACGGGVGEVNDDGSLVTVDGVDITTAVDKTNLYDITINGTKDDVTIAPKNTVLTMTISGTNNDVVISPNATVNNIVLNGVDNTLHLPVGYYPTISQSGTGNSVVHQ
jgi:hypothetical protein